MSYWDMYNKGLPSQYFPMQRDSLGNAQGMDVPSYNQIGADDSLAVAQAKQAAQNRQLQGMTAEDRNRMLWMMGQQQAGQQQGGAPWANAVAQIAGALINKNGGQDNLLSRFLGR